PMVKGKISDLTRIRELVPTLKYLADQKAKVVVLSHFDRPGGKFVPSLSLAPLVDVVAAQMGGDYAVHFGVDCVGQAARKAVDRLPAGEILLLENVRFHAGEEANDPDFARELASLGEVYINEAFSTSHREHASVVGIAEHLPAYAGFLLQKEVETFDALLNNPKRPLVAVVGGAKISTKLAILDHLVTKVNYLVVGGAMANTFLYAQGLSIGKSLYEPELVETAKHILDHAKKEGCEVLLPHDVVVARKLDESAPCEIVSADAIPDDAMQLDVGPETVLMLSQLLQQCHSLVWNGPLGAFETRPFDVSTVALARLVAGRTRQGELFSIAGGGDTVSLLSHAGLESAFTYLSTAGGAFLEWMQGKVLPGVKVVQK
ncbi:MAG: phosphoglycerate kinase, partial [Rickettsiales bacterium]